MYVNYVRLRVNVSILEFFCFFTGVLDLDGGFIGFLLNEFFFYERILELPVSFNCLFSKVNFITSVYKWLFYLFI